MSQDVWRTLCTKVDDLKLTNARGNKLTKSLRDCRLNCGLDPRWLGDGDVCGSVAAFPLRQVVSCDIRLWRHRLRLLLLEIGRAHV